MNQTTNEALFDKRLLKRVDPSTRTHNITRDPILEGEDLNTKPRETTVTLIKEKLPI